MATREELLTDLEKLRVGDPARAERKAAGRRRKQALGPFRAQGLSYRQALLAFEDTQDVDGAMVERTIARVRTVTP